MIKKEILMGHKYSKATYYSKVLESNLELKPKAILKIFQMTILNFLT